MGFRYIRAADRRPLATLYIDQDRFGLAICNTKDQFVKKTGRQLAEASALATQEDFSSQRELLNKCVRKALKLEILEISIAMAIYHRNKQAFDFLCGMYFDFTGKLIAQRTF